jgi:hypothetical protein
MWVIYLFVFFSSVLNAEAGAPLGTHEGEYVTIAILAKDKAFALPLYLACIEQQTWPKDKTHIYIRTNNNNDATAQILREWVSRVEGKYASIKLDDSDVPERVQDYKPHEWNATRFKVLGKIRQDSLAWAKERKSHYFVADCDNFILPGTIEALFHSCQSIVAPLLKCTTSVNYSNYHFAIDNNGYYADSPAYYQVLSQEIKGLIEVPVVHCTYFIRHEVLDKLVYDDNSYRYEYVIFSDSARKQKIPQYLDNRQIYGYLTFAENDADLAKESWLQAFPVACRP